MNCGRPVLQSAPSWAVGLRLRRCPNSEPTSVECLVLAGDFIYMTTINTLLRAMYTKDYVLCISTGLYGDADHGIVYHGAGT